MKKEVARTFWRRYLGLVCNGSASSCVENPAIRFTIKAKSGEYDNVSDEKYDELLNNCEQLSAIWHGAAQRSAGDLFLDALQMTSISRECREKIIGLLAECSSDSDYLSKTKGQNGGSEPGHRYPSVDVPDSAVMAEPDDWSPRSIYDYLCKRIRGQEEAKKAAAMILYNHIEGRRSNAVFCGPSGCGKSEIWRHLAKDYPNIIRIVDASRMSADGWKGSIHLRDIFESAYEKGTKGRGLIVVLDEADKICCEKAVGAGGTDYNALVQNSLLKMLDGDIIEFGSEEGNKKAFKVNCSRVSVVLLGAFEHLMQNKSQNTGTGIGFSASLRTECNYDNTDITYDDLIAAGMRREIAGRINRIVSLHPLSVSDYRAILTGPIMEDLQATGHYIIKIDEHSAEVLSEQASKTELGARWMRSQVMNRLDDLMFEDPKADVYTLHYPAAG